MRASHVGRETAERICREERVSERSVEIKKQVAKIKQQFLSKKTKEGKTEIDARALHQHQYDVKEH